MDPNVHSNACSTLDGHCHPRVPLSGDEWTPWLIPTSIAHHLCCSSGGTTRCGSDGPFVRAFLSPPLFSGLRPPLSSAASHPVSLPPWTRLPLRASTRPPSSSLSQPNCYPSLPPARTRPPPSPAYAPVRPIAAPCPFSRGLYLSPGGLRLGLPCRRWRWLGSDPFSSGCWPTAPAGRLTRTRARTAGGRRWVDRHRQPAPHGPARARPAARRRR
jgi:hypothetical protein